METFAVGNFVAWNEALEDDKGEEISLKLLMFKELQGGGPFMVARIIEVTRNTPEAARHPQRLILEDPRGQEIPLQDLTIGFCGMWFVKIPAPRTRIN